MGLKEDLELIRGGPIHSFSGDPMEIPCFETSDHRLLCRHPVVSVHMITYNHEPYIRQAIEGVMMQQADFEFELVIGEDCSTDRTREICFEYQKRHPDKVRVLWSQENSYLHMHPAGGNAQRTMVRCRGEFVAFCEGDDYWTDPLKLQKQVGVMRSNAGVAICFCRVSSFCQKTGRFETVRYDTDPVGRMPGADMNRALMLDLQDRRRLIRQHCIETSGILFRRRAYDEGQLNGVEKWYLSFEDTIAIERCLASGDAYFLPEEMSVYRCHCGGVYSILQYNYAISNDAALVKYYLAQKRFGMSREDALRLFGNLIFCCLSRYLVYWKVGYVSAWRSFFKYDICRRVCLTKRNFMSTVVIFLGLHRFAFVRNHTLGLSYRLFGPRIRNSAAMEIFRRNGIAVSENHVFVGKDIGK